MSRNLPNKPFFALGSGVAGGGFCCSGAFTPLLLLTFTRTGCSCEGVALLLGASEKVLGG